MGRNSGPPADYDPRTSDPMQATRHSWGCLIRIGAIVLVLIVVALLWWIGIPTESSLK